MVPNWEFVLITIRILSREVMCNFPKLVRAASWRVISFVSDYGDTVNFVFSCLGGVNKYQACQLGDFLVVSQELPILSLLIS